MSEETLSSMHDARDAEDKRLLEAKEHTQLLCSCSCSRSRHWRVPSSLVGSVMIFFQPSELAFGWLSLVVLLIGALAASESVVVSKRAGRLHPVAMNFVAMTAGAAALLVASAAAGERLVLPAEGEPQLALVYLVFATVALFLCVLVVVQR